MVLMNPNQPSGSIPPVPNQPAPGRSNNPYGFILDTEHQPKKPLLQNRNSLRSRLLIVVGGGVGLVILLVIILSLANGGKTDNGKLLGDLVAEQAEIVRVADQGANKGIDPSVRAFAEIAKLSVASQQARLTSYLEAHGVKLTPAQIDAKKSESTDTALNQAISNNRFDDVFTETLKSSLQTYSADLKNNYNVASNADSKKILSDSFTSTTSLLK